MIIRFNFMTVTSTSAPSARSLVPGLVINLCDVTDTAPHGGVKVEELVDDAERICTVLLLEIAPVKFLQRLDRQALTSFELWPANGRRRRPGLGDTTIQSHLVNRIHRQKR